MVSVRGIHHITAITGNPQANIDFYEGFLGQRLVKRTVNFDDPRSYHLYFGDTAGTPGTLITFFHWEHLPPGERGAGEVSRIAYRISPNARDFWVTRAREYGVPCTEYTNELGEETIGLDDPDGIRIELVLDERDVDVVWWDGGAVPQEMALRGFHGAGLSVVGAEEMDAVLAEMGYQMETRTQTRVRYTIPDVRAGIIDCIIEPDAQRSRQGNGSVHHIAFRVRDDGEQQELRTRITKLGTRPTPVIDRLYFRSVYFMTPSGILFELATEEPGFAIDEPLDELGEHFVLPPQHEPRREEIEKALPRVVLPRHRD